MSIYSLFPSNSSPQQPFNVTRISIFHVRKPSLRVEDFPGIQVSER